MILARYEKQPAEVKDYNIDYGPWLLSSADTISAVSAVVTGLTDATNTALTVDSTDFTDTLVKVWVSGGTADCDYKITVQVTTAGGRLDESELVFRVRDR